MRVAEYHLGFQDEEHRAPVASTSTFDPAELASKLAQGWDLTGITARTTPACFSPAPGKCTVVVVEQAATDGPDPEVDR